MKKGKFNLSFNHINQLIHDKDWTTIVKEIHLSLSDNNIENVHALLEAFEKVDEDYRKKYCLDLYLQLWMPALRSGKVKLARTYVQNVIEILTKYKRIPFLRKFIFEVKKQGLLKNINADDLKFRIIYGSAHISDIQLSDYWEIMQLHPESWKASRDFLRQFLLSKEEWTQETWKLAYEFILKFHYDKEIMIFLSSKAEELKKDKFKILFEKYLREKNIIIPAEKPHIQTRNHSEKSFLKVDYDELALDVISGELIPNTDEQRKVLLSIKDISEKELLSSGLDMVVAFNLLGMELVVLELCSKLLPITEDVQRRASLHFIMAQTLFDNHSYHKTLDVIYDVLENEPLLEDEILAFEYLKAETLLKLNRKDLAKSSYLKIRKLNPHYRLVGQRLKELEAVQ